MFHAYCINSGVLNVIRLLFERAKDVLPRTKIRTNTHTNSIERDIVYKTPFGDKRLKSAHVRKHASTHKSLNVVSFVAAAVVSYRGAIFSF